MTPHPPPRRRVRAAALLAGGGLVAAALTVASPAQSIPINNCPTTVAPSSLTAGQSVHGLTTVSGTSPEGFTGTVTGVLTDGIAPGVDLILMDLHSATIDRAGIWEGMSGSPVYDDNGDLIGAVSETLSWGATSVAGVTPAPEMAKLLSGNVAPGPLGRHVTVPRAMARRLVASGAATSAQVAHGLTQLRMPMTVAGLSAARLRKVAPKLKVAGLPMSTTAGATVADALPIVAGGNLGASASYGTVPMYGLGTATMVCGDEVVGFGHPLTYEGRTTLGMHGASAVEIQADPQGSSFKVANLGAPIGAVTDDRLVGIHGTVGASLPSSGIGVTASQGANTFTGLTHVTLPEVLPDAGYYTMVASQEKVMDRIGKGSIAASWTIYGNRRNGAPFRLHRSDVYTDTSDVSSASAYALASDLAALQDNEAEPVTIRAVRATSKVSNDAASYQITKVQAPAFGRWQTLREDRPVVLQAGKVARLRVSLFSRDAGRRVIFVRVFVPVHAAGRTGSLDVLGGDTYAEGSDDFFEGDDFSFEEPGLPAEPSFPATLRALTAGPQHNQVQATVVFRRAPGAAHRPRTGTTTLNRVVSGEIAVPVVAVR